MKWGWPHSVRNCDESPERTWPSSLVDHLYVVKLKAKLFNLTVERNGMKLFEIDASEIVPSF